jgi:hypothetical protein
MNRIGGIGEGLDVFSRMEWMVGTAVYQLQPCWIKSSQNVWAENFNGMTTLEWVTKGARRPQTSPWTVWRRGGGEEGKREEGGGTGYQLVGRRDELGGRTVE